MHDFYRRRGRRGRRGVLDRKEPESRCQGELSGAIDLVRRLMASCMSSRVFLSCASSSDLTAGDLSMRVRVSGTIDGLPHWPRTVNGSSNNALASGAAPPPIRLAVPKRL